MALTALIEKVCQQKAVYWEFTGRDRYGGAGFASPVQVMVRWDDKTEKVEKDNGVMFTSTAQLLIKQDMKKGSRIILGDIADYPGSDPTQYDKSRVIETVQRTAQFGASEFTIFRPFCDGY